LFYINSRVIINSIDIFKDENFLHTIKCIYPSYDKLLVYHYDKDNKKHHFAKYKIEGNNLIFEQENSRFKMESSIIDMGIMKKGHLVTLSFDGVIRFFSQEQISDNEKDDEIFEKQEKENNSDFILSSLIYEKKSKKNLSSMNQL
jgi:antitoxin component YwqK of YwqJK toxin-antitoxin module